MLNLEMHDTLTLVHMISVEYRFGYTVERFENTPAVQVGGCRINNKPKLVQVMTDDPIHWRRYVSLGLIYLKQLRPRVQRTQALKWTNLLSFVATLRHRAVNEI